MSWTRQGPADGPADGPAAGGREAAAAASSPKKAASGGGGRSGEGGGGGCIVSSLYLWDAEKIKLYYSTCSAHRLVHCTLSSLYYPRVSRAPRSFDLCLGRRRRGRRREVATVRQRGRRERERERERAAERRRERETKEAPSIKCVGIFKQNESEIYHRIYQSLITPDIQSSRVLLDTPSSLGCWDCSVRIYRSRRSQESGVRVVF